MPYRVGIVGTDNSHAAIFSQIANGVDQANYVPGFEVTHLFGLDSKRNQEVAEKGKISNIVSKPSEMLGKIDVAFVEFRHGGLHLKYAKPFIEKGIPVFVDKPLAASTVDARKVLQLAKKKRIPFTSFSTLRFAAAVQEFKSLVSAEQPVYLSVLGPGDMKSEYGGLIFYGIHPAEILNEIAGQGVKEVMAVRKDRSVSATLLHTKFVGNIRISPDIPYLFSIEAVTKKSILTRKVDTTTCYRDGMIKLKEMLDNKKWPLTDKDMFEPVAVINAIGKSMTSGRRTKVEHLAR